MDYNWLPMLSPIINCTFQEIPRFIPLHGYIPYYAYDPAEQGYNHWNTYDYKLKNLHLGNIAFLIIIIKYL